MSQRNLSLEFIRASACLMVVILHCAGSFSSHYSTEFNWWSASFINSLTRCSVPLFVMITGVLLGNNFEEPFLFIKKRVTRILFPLLIWAGIYLIFYHFLNGDSLSFKKIVSQMISGPVSFHFWYLYMILGLYLFIPIINPWLQKANSKDILYFLAIWQIVSFIYPVYEYKMGMSPGILLVNFVGYLGYYVLGYAIVSKKILQNVSGTISLFLYVSGILFTYIGIIWMSNGKSNPNLFLHDYLFPNVAISAIGFFILSHRFELGNKFKLYSELIGKLSFGIYLVHIIPLKLFFYYFPDPIIPIPMLDLLLPSLIVFISSAGIIYILTKIPYTNKFLY